MPTSDTKITPMIRQYLEIKKEYADYILFYRMGDFFEMFFEDAKTASRALEITLTSRNKNEQAPVPMCGVPVKAADTYLARLVEKGYRVAICDQTEDPSAAKGLVRREVVRVVTPGMVVNESLLDRRANNFVLSVFVQRNRYGLSCLDLSTGTFRLCETHDSGSLTEEVMRIAPAEVVLPESAAQDEAYSPFVNAFSTKAATYFSDDAYAPDMARQRLIGQFKTRSLEGFGCEGLVAGIGAAGALLAYVSETQKQAAPHIHGIETYSLDQYLLVDSVSCRNLELLKNLSTGSRQGSLINVMDMSVTAMGSRLIRQWMRYPLTDEGQIGMRLDAVEAGTINSGERKAVRETLKRVSDLERLCARISMGQANARDLVAVKDSILALPDIMDILLPLNVALLSADPSEFLSLYELADIIGSAIADDPPLSVHEGGMIRAGHHPPLDELIAIARDGKKYLAGLETSEREKTGINTLKIRYNKVFGYFIETSKAAAANVPAHYVRKQTLVNAERYITDELKIFETKVINAREKRVAMEYDLFSDIRLAVLEKIADLQAAAAFVARADALFALAEVAAVNDYHRPRINTGGIIEIEDGRHPVIERLIPAGRFVPNTIRMDNEENQVLIVTGPNMAGKSTVLRQVALTALMAQMGSFVSAHRANMTIVDRIFTRVGALDNLSQGQSTFMVEMEETANILNNAGPDSLVIMDEIGRGTSTFDGLSIAWAVAQYLHDLAGKGVKSLFATHYHELMDLSKIKSRVKNFSIAVREWNEEIIFLHRLVEGGTNKSYGIQVARLAGIPDQVIRTARSVLANIEKEGHVLKKRGCGKKERPLGNVFVQLPLFRPPEEIIMEKLMKLDVSTITPIDALNFLNLLKREVDRGYGKQQGRLG
ncbi:MAG: DNA mismatch repair protein MutS [Deltaproteobacteria bacterium]|nr:DNA mismatch repair protein MutS [Deltaproteobacteria bacterium]